MPTVSGSTLANNVTSAELWLPNYLSSEHKHIITTSAIERDNASGQRFGRTAVWWENTAAIARIEIVTDNDPTDVFASGWEMMVIGVKEEAIGAASFATYNTTNVSSPPTASELSTNLGAPSTANRGKLWLLDDGGADANVYLVASNGTSWWYAAMTKAT